MFRNHKLKCYYNYTIDENTSINRIHFCHIIYNYDYTALIFHDLYPLLLTFIHNRFKSNIFFIVNLYFEIHFFKQNNLGK